MPYKRRRRRRAAPVGMPKLPTRAQRRLAHLSGLLDHAKLSHRYWLGEARLTRLGLSESRYGGHYAIDGAGNWRRRAAELLAELRPLQLRLRPSR